MIISHSSPTAGNRINGERDSAIHGGFYWPGKEATFDTDPRSISLITGRVAKIQAKATLGESMAPFIWRDSANNNHEFTATEFLQFAVAMDEWVESKYIESWQKKAAL